MIFKSTSLVLGIALLGSVSACSSKSDSETNPFGNITGTTTGGDTNANGNNADPNNGNGGETNGGQTSNTGDTNGGLDASATNGAGDASATSGADAALTTGGDASTAPDSGSVADAGTIDAGNTGGSTPDASSPSDAGGGGLDADVLPDAAVATDASTTLPDAAVVIDAGPGPSSDASTDASTDGGPTCGTDGLIAGNDCAGVVTCQDNNFSGDPVLACSLVAVGSGTASRCCTAPIGASNSCRTTACGANDDEAKCDGPEDCAGNATGALCCFTGGATSCAASCANADLLCHEDKDCPSGAKCATGHPTQYSWWGFCRGT